MVKISRPIIYIVLAGVVGYAVVVLTEPEKPTKKASTKTASRTTTTLKGFTAEDMTAHFPRYTSAPRNAFQPKVIPTKKNIATTVGAPPGGGIAELWALTGVSTVNNVVNALVECASTGESVFLKVGDTWKGCQVRSIGSNTVQLVSSEGAPIQLGFADPTKQKVAPGVVQGGGIAPLLLSSPAPVPAAPAGVVPPVDPNQDRASRRAGRRAARQQGEGE